MFEKCSRGLQECTVGGVASCEPWEVRTHRAAAAGLCASTLETRWSFDSQEASVALRKGLILLFYLVFYGFLAGMFTLTMWVMLQTLDENVPRHQDRVANPGLVIRPHASEISFNRSDPTNYNQYIEQLHDLLQHYNDSLQERNDLCLVGEYTEQDDELIKKVCQFKRSTLRQCSGLPDASFGYAEGKPCIIIKMNRVIGLKPQGDPYINCTAKRDSPLQMQYFPSEGRLDKMFFPYYGKKAHEQ